MRAPQPPTTSLLAWLTVFVFLLAGGPAPGKPAGRQDSQQRVTAANELAGDFASLDLANTQGCAPFRLLKARDLVDSPASVLFAAPVFLLPLRLKARRAAPATVRRLGQAGMLELRL
jgi:hypothetical protein